MSALKEAQIRIGRFSVRVACELPAFWKAFDFFYSDNEREPTDGFCDFSVKLLPPGLFQRPFRPRLTFDLDGVRPFKPLPAHQAFALFEWGLNWCVAMHVHRYVLIHAAVLERNGFALILPAPPGSGKSTLCAALSSRGWRLLSDELAMIDPDTLNLIPFPRPVSLKNQSIDIMRAYAGSACIGPVFPDTHKGNVAHMRVPAGAIEHACTPAQPGWIAFPKYRAGAPLQLAPLTRARTVVGLADNSFNSDRLGEQAFRTLANIAATSGCFEFEYSVLDEAIACFDGLATPRGAA
ncbi:HprK-related kinase A [Methyloversatilis sp.]|uniref:HprK-related kinase A n=1 Tax=Methyloversatilis sp. TaxID=2569862 RepID=UPI0035ADABA8